MESQEESQPPSAEQPTAGATPAAEVPRQQQLPRGAGRTDRLPSVGRAQLTPFMSLVNTHSMQPWIQTVESHGCSYCFVIACTFHSLYINISMLLCRKCCLSLYCKMLKIVLLCEYE